MSIRYLKLGTSPEKGYVPLMALSFTAVDEMPNVDQSLANILPGGLFQATTEVAIEMVKRNAAVLIDLKSMTDDALWYLFPAVRKQLARLVLDDQFKDLGDKHVMIDAGSGTLFTAKNRKEADSYEKLGHAQRVNVQGLEVPVYTQIQSLEKLKGESDGTNSKEDN